MYAHFPSVFARYDQRGDQDRLDSIYLRFDFTSGSNCGFGFVNFCSLDALVRFWSARTGTFWDSTVSRKVVMGGFAELQGKAALVSKFRNSHVMDQEEG